MKYTKILIPFLLVILLFSCVNDRKDKNTGHNTETTFSKKPDTLKNIPWSAELDTNTQVFTLVKNESINTQDLDSSNILKAINSTYPESPIVWDKKSGDTAYVKIPNSTFLTQQSGTLGAKVFLAESTYSITEIPGINVVNFNFKIGDHATPGSYTRKDFNFSMP